MDFTESYTKVIQYLLDSIIINDNKKIICDKDLLQNISIKLPDFIKHKIYSEYLEPLIYFDLYNNLLLYSVSIGTNYLYLSKLLPSIFCKDIIKNYFIKECAGFRFSFEKHKKDNNKFFILLKKGESFALSILYYYYH
jgi:hypothetical protein